MPLTSLQSECLRLLAANRDPENYVVGSAFFTRSGSRISGDIDIFHDREMRVGQAADLDAKVLEAAEVLVAWQRRGATFYQTLVSRTGETTRLEWVVDSEFRFFPVQKDPDFGYVLHPVDLATNKIMAAAGRREPRDIVDALTVHSIILPLGAVIWAAVEKAPGFTPEGLINEVRRNARYTEADFRRIASIAPVDAAATMQKLRDALEKAEVFVSKMPTELAGRLFLEKGKAIEPDPDRLGDYQTRSSKRQGHWPSSA